MNFLYINCYLTFIACVLCKNNVVRNAAPLTESMGQEIIEIGSPLKGLPPEIEEEPSAENDDDSVILPATKKVDTRRSNLNDKQSKAGRSANEIDQDEKRIEKELAEIYKDNADYKNDFSDTLKVTSKTSIASTKAVARAGNHKEPKFEPDALDKLSVERFKTSIDEIECGMKLKGKESVTPITPDKNGAVRLTISSLITLAMAMFV